MTNNNLSCADDQTAELYAMNRLNPASTETYEEHLLICSPCIDRVQGSQEYIVIFRAAAVSLQ